MKKCKTCEEIKPFEDYYTLKDSKGYEYTPRNCKKCHNKDVYECRLVKMYKDGHKAIKWCVSCNKIFRSSYYDKCKICNV